MPEIEALAEEFADKATVYKLDLTRFFNKIVKRDFAISGLPTYLVYKDGVEVARLQSDEALDTENIRAAVTAALGEQQPEPPATP